MSTSISYRAQRERPLADAERWQIARVLADFYVDPLAAPTSDGGIVDWSPLEVDPPDPDAPDVVFSGKTRLPSTSLDHMWTGVQHWCDALTAVRRVLPDAHWHVAVEDHVIPWDEQTNQFNPHE